MFKRELSIAGDRNQEQAFEAPHRPTTQPDRRHIDVAEPLFRVKPRVRGRSAIKRNRIVFLCMFSLLKCCYVLQ